MAGRGQKVPKSRFLFAICTRCFEKGVTHSTILLSLVRMISEDVGTCARMTSYEMQDSRVSWKSLRNGQELRDYGY